MSNPDYCHDAWTIRRAHNLDFSQGVSGEIDKLESGIAELEDEKS